MSATLILADASGALVKRFAANQPFSAGLHSVFGFSSERSAAERGRNRHRRGLVTTGAGWAFRFRYDLQQGPVALQGCSVEKLSSGKWKLLTARGEFALTGSSEGVLAPSSARTAADREPERRDRALWFLLSAFFVGFALYSMLRPAEIAVIEAPLPEPVNVQVIREETVVVPKPEQLVAPVLPKVVQQDKKAARAVQQNLGFLSLLGRKDFKKAVGGTPIEVKDVSPGAGAGGNAGSGGELISGLGEGVHRTTVGNTGVQGLGGIGTKGAGGGQGGYGNSLVGSGQGRGLSAVALSQDLVLEGGLDRNVIQATIAKYLNQVRACYEAGLRRSPGIAGQVSMNFEIAASGALNFARVSKSSLGDSEVEQCIATRMMGWQFPKPVGAVAVKVNYPFVLRPTGG
jgi:hypothetical protein